MLTDGIEAVSQTGMVCEGTKGSFTLLNLYFVIIRNTVTVEL